MPSETRMFGLVLIAMLVVYGSAIGTLSWWAIDRFAEGAVAAETTR